MFDIKQNDTSPAILKQAVDANGLPINLTGAVVVFNMASLSGTLVCNRKAASVFTGLLPDGSATVTAAAGWVRYQWQAVDTLTAGEHVAEFEITHAGGAVETVPNHGHETILISPDISAANFTFPPPVVPPLVPGYAYAVGFPSRAALVTWAAGATVVAGTVASAEGYAYRYLGMGTSIADLPGWIINGPAYAGDVTSPQDSLTLTIPANSVPNAKLATVATATIKGRATAGTGNVEDLTAAQAKAVLTITATDVAMSGGGTAQEYAGFATRASFVAWASGKAPAVGSVVDVAGRRYRYIGSGTAISDLAGWIPDSAAFLDMWPNTLAGFQEALTYCSGSTLSIAPGTYAYSSAADNFFTPVDNTRIVGAGRGLVNITFTGSAAFWYVFRGANFFMDGCSVTLAFSADGQGYLYIMAVGNGARFLNNSLTVNYLFSAGVYVRQGSLMQIASGAATYDEIVIERNDLAGIAYAILRSNTALSTTRRIRINANRIVSATKEPFSINAPTGVVEDLLITNNICDGHVGGANGTDGHYIGVSGVKRVVITGNVMRGFCREAIHIENVAGSVVVTDNAMHMDFTGIASAAMISVIPGLLSAGLPPERVVIANNICVQTGTPKSGVGVWVADFSSGNQSTSGKHVLVNGNIVENVDYGFDMVVGGDMGCDVSGNLAVGCYKGFINRYENAGTYHDNTSKDCTYGVGSYTLGRFTRHRFINCTNIAGAAGGVASAVALENFTVVLPDRAFTAASNFNYVLAGGFDSLARTDGKISVSVNDISLSHYLYASMLTDWNGTALDSTAGISRAVNATATMSVSAGNLICNIAVTVAKTNCRFSAEFQGTALLSTAVIP